MKNRLSISLWFSCLVLLLSFTEGRSQGFVQAEGQKIVDEEGEELILRGIGLGGWMLQEGYMLRTSGPQHEIEARIEDLIGPEKKQEFYDAWLANHTRKIDIDSMAAWGYNSVRLPMHYKLFTPPIEEEPVPGEITWLEKGFEMTDQLLEWAKANNMYLILDLHAAPGGQGENADINDYDPSKPSLWESEANQAKTVALWRKLAERYANEPHLAAYDLINEPNWGFQNHAADPNGCSESQNILLWELQKRISEAIREVDPNHLIIIEGNCWGNNYAGLPGLWDDNMALSFHKYWNPNTEGAIRGILNLREQRNVPVWLGETGENSNTWFTNAIQLVEGQRIGWAWWPLKKQGMNNPLEIKSPEGYQQILDYWSNPQSAPKPAPDEAYQVLMQLTENLKLENNIYHRDVVDAMIRQPHSDEAIPFKNHVIAAAGPSRIFVTDFDLGRHEVAYHDTEVSNTTGNAGGLAWNQGYAYRNDGVDIQVSEDEESNGYNVGWTETGEWLQYTVQVEEEGYYTLRLRTASENANGKVSFRSNRLKITHSIDLPNTGGWQSWQTVAVEDVYLRAGSNVIRLLVDNGGFNISHFEFVRQEGPHSDQPQLMEGSIQHGENSIRLVFNQAFDAVPQEHGFSVKVNGQAVDVTEVSLAESNPQLIEIRLAEAVSFGHEVLLSYEGTALRTTSGVALGPFNDSPIAVLTDVKVLRIPGRIEAEDFTENNGLQLENTTDTGGGQNIGHTSVGDYLVYTVLVEGAGTYEVDYRIASQSAGGKMKLQLVQENGSLQDLTSVEFGPTGGWQSWRTIRGNPVTLAEGLLNLRIYVEKTEFNLNWFEFSPADPENPGNPTGLWRREQNPQLISIYPNPSNGNFWVEFPDLKGKATLIMLWDLTGKILFRQKLSKDDAAVNINLPLLPGIYFIVLVRNGQPVVKKIVVS
jgi:endoglucanase